MIIDDKKPKVVYNLIIS